jgi:hypothetical protein
MRKAETLWDKGESSSHTRMIAIPQALYELCSGWCATRHTAGEP